MLVIQKQLCLLLMEQGRLEDVCDYLILVKCFTDIVESFKQMDKNAIVFIVSSIL